MGDITGLGLWGTNKLELELEPELEVEEEPDVDPDELWQTESTATVRGGHLWQILLILPSP